MCGVRLFAPGRTRSTRKKMTPLLNRNAARGNLIVEITFAARHRSAALVSFG